MNTHPPFGRGGGFGFAPAFHQTAPGALAWATFALVLLLVLTIGALLVARLARGRQRGWGRPAGRGFGGPPGRRHDPVDLLRWRYARGEISRDEFVQGVHDLTPAPAGAEPPPG